VLHETLDRAARARGVAALEQDPVLQLEELDLEQPPDAVVLGTVEPVAVGVALTPGAEVRRRARPVAGVVVGVVDAESGVAGEEVGDGHARTIAAADGRQVNRGWPGRGSG
jgi:hypothetical protein